MNKEYEFVSKEGIEWSKFVNREVVGFQLGVKEWMIILGFKFNFKGKFDFLCMLWRKKLYCFEWLRRVVAFCNLIF